MKKRLRLYDYTRIPGGKMCAVPKLKFEVCLLDKYVKHPFPFPLTHTLNQISANDHGTTICGLWTCVMRDHWSDK